LSNCATWATVYQRGVKIISVSGFAIMINTYAFGSCKETDWTPVSSSGQR